MPPRKDKKKAENGVASSSDVQKSAPGTAGKAGKWLKRHPILTGLVAVSAVAPAVLLRPEKMQVKRIDRVHISDLSQTRFFEEFAQKKPLIVTGAWDSKPYAVSRIKETCDLAQVRTFIFDSLAGTWGKQVLKGVVPLAQYLGQYFGPVAERPSPILYGFEVSLKQHCPQILEDTKIPWFLSEDTFHLVTNSSGLGWPSMLFGPDGTETGLHIDTHRLPFWIAVNHPEPDKSGALNQPLKLFRIFSHEEKRLLRYGGSTKESNFNFNFDPWVPDLAKYPLLKEIPVMEEMLYSGDLLYIPGGSPHAVKNHGDNTAVSMNFLDLAALPDFVRGCAKGGSPLCGFVAGKGNWVLNALQARRDLNKDMSYFEFAGVDSKEQFCKVHLQTIKQQAENPKAEKQPALELYCKDFA